MLLADIMSLDEVVNCAVQRASTMAINRSVELSWLCCTTISAALFGIVNRMAPFKYH